MAVIGASYPTLSDVSARLDPKGKIASIAEIIQETNEVIEDVFWVEGNLPTGHKLTQRSGYPDVTWRLFNYGVPQSKSRTTQITETCGMLEAYSEIDKDLAMLNGNTAAFRLSEDKAFLEGMAEEFATKFFYGDTTTTPEEILGLAPRYASLSGAVGENVLDAGGTGSDNTSIWLVTWDSSTLFGIYPNGSKAGLQFQDLGEQTLFDTNTPIGRYQGYRSHYQWKCGLALKDWRYVVRICNIDVNMLTKDATGASADLIDLMTQAIELLPTQNRGRKSFYCNRTIKSFLRRQISNKDNVNLTLDNVSGKHVMAFDGIPVKKCDAILETEQAIF